MLYRSGSEGCPTFFMAEFATLDRL